MNKGFIMSDVRLGLGFRLLGYEEVCYNEPPYEEAKKGSYIIYEIEYGDSYEDASGNLIVEVVKVIRETKPKSNYVTGYVNFKSGTFNGIFYSEDMYLIDEAPYIRYGYITYKVEYDITKAVEVDGNIMSNYIIVRAIEHIGAQ